ncbi:Lipase member M [Colius striatus]|uniref:Lipase n=1 Tax=Colius striatus TaxID=57412 RepID=A0A091K0Q1_COLST|nr:Lipase member M [Colius striatus]
MMSLFVIIAYFMFISVKSDTGPEASMDMEQIVRYHGYPYEEHEVVTDDGYYLTMQRIPHGRDNSGTPKRVVLLQHGLALEGSNWVTNLPNSSLGFILADAGYDVWMGNNRGNSWSRKHQEFDFYQEEYSSYSFHEMAVYDLPAMINYILKKTGQEQLYYVAYSQGTTIGLIAFSSIPELDRKIKMFFALAPVSTVSKAKAPVLWLFKLPEGLFKLIFGYTVVFDKSNIWKQVISNLCCHSIPKSFCSLILHLVGGFTYSLNMEGFLGHFFYVMIPSNAWITNIALLLSQLYQTGEFKYYDYGSDNMLHYNQMTPHFYELENMKAPFAAWYGGRDWLTVPEDTHTTLSRITNVVYKKYIPEFAHFDFLWSTKAYEQVYKEILELMKDSA